MEVNKIQTNHSPLNDKRFSQITSSLILLFCIMWPIFIHHILNKNYTLQLIVLQIILYYLIIYILSRKNLNNAF